jgi:hypothetical protein
LLSDTEKRSILGGKKHKVSGTEKIPDTTTDQSAQLIRVRQTVIDDQQDRLQRRIDAART